MSVSKFSINIWMQMKSFMRDVDSSKGVKVFKINFRVWNNHQESLLLYCKVFDHFSWVLINNFDILEERIVQLLNKLKENHLLINKLKTDNNEFEKKSSSLKIQILELKKENESLKMANSLLGSKESRAITKRKINSLIKEVDFCIHQLSEIR